ncbi:MAG TPA: GDP-mannose 4,6-dehydratase [Polyangiaceae bacterium]|jgi:GDP-4-dehydro-6-deoxy-D-mannose reductase|nr:GDP-mannose 4,6-dehydratase [Polyangiaceae bacterium]
MKVLVTGPDGFVGGHLCRGLAAAGHDVVEARGPGMEEGLDIRDAARVDELLHASLPDAVVHLAAVSSVGKSHRDPVETLDVNVVGTAALLSAARKAVPSARLLVVGSGEVYGRTSGGVPAAEDAPLEPLSPYAASKAAAEMVALQFHRSYGTDVVCVRSFSHIGRGQAPDFAIPSFAAQLAAIRRGEAPPVLRTGDLTPVRDFLHVADVVDAYELLLRKGRAGSVYNVASGEGHSIRSLLDEMLDVSRVQAKVEVDPSRLRPVEIPVLLGDPARLKALGWTRRRTVRDALRDVLDEHGAL